MRRFIVFHLLTLALTAGPAAAGTVHSYDEEFTSWRYRDPAFTTALWDTVAGELKLPPFDMRVVGSLTVAPAPRDIAIAGDVAYLAGYISSLQSGILSVDISDPEHPALLDFDSISYGYFYGIDVEGDYAYVADKYPRFHVYGISDPGTLTLAGSYSPGGYLYDVKACGKYVYLAADTLGLLVMNVSNPSSPALAARRDTPGNSCGLALDGSLMFVADGANGIVAVDVSDPPNPALLGGAATAGAALKLAVSGDLLCVAEGAVGVQIFDISSPASPSLLATVDTPGSATDVWIWGDLAFVADGSAGLIAIDISDPEHPWVSKSCDTPGFATGLAVAGEHAYVADDAGDLQVIEICTRTAPALVGGLDVAAEPAWGVAVRGDVAYVTHNFDGLKVLDVSDPTHPSYLGGYNSPGYVMRLVVEGDYAFLADGDNGMQAVEVSNPSIPTPVGQFPAEGGAVMDIAVVSDLAYLANSTAGLRIVDITDPYHPSLTGGFSPGQGTQSVAVAGNRAYLGVTASGLVVVDISDPAAPTQIATLSGVPVKDIAIAGDRAYMVGGSGSNNFRVVNITDPAAPTLVGSLTIPYTVWQVDLFGDFAYVAHDGDLSCQGGGVDIIDISDPAAPVNLTTCPVSCGAGGATVDGNYVYAAAWEAGLKVFRVSSQLDAAANVGHSLAVDGATDTIVRVSFTSTHTDSIRWDLTADDGANWQAIAPGGAWHVLAHPGSDLRWRSTHVYTLDNPTCTALDVHWLYDCAAIDTIADVPDDQGGWARVHFSRSGYDFADQAVNPITGYYVFRRVDPLPGKPGVLYAASAGAALPGKLPATLCGLPVTMLGDRPCIDVTAATTAAMPPGTWEVVGSVPAHQQDEYICLVPTLADSAETMVLTEYCVSAETTTPSVYYISRPVSGYSVDNIAPGVPGEFAVAYSPTQGNFLSWDSCSDEDFQYYRIYRGETEDFEPAPENCVHLTIVTEWTDPPTETWYYHYKVSAVDRAGNESLYASPSTVTGTIPEALPKVVALRQNAPNPFGPRTAIRFSLPLAASIELRVYDLSGRVVRSLFDGQVLPAGSHEAVWDGRNQTGTRVATGVYLCRLRAGAITKTMRMALLN